MINLHVKYVVDEKFRTTKGNIKYLEELRVLARRNRLNPTLAEKGLRNKIRKFKPQFLRQKPIGRFIIDYYCPNLLLAVEIDGNYHKRRVNYDEGRSEVLKSMGIVTIRFSNEEVLNNTVKVLRELERNIRILSKA